MTIVVCPLVHSETSVLVPNDITYCRSASRRDTAVAEPAAFLVYGTFPSIQQVGSSCRVAQHEHHRVTAQEHFADVAVLVDGLRLLLSLPCLRLLCPHLLHVGQHPAEYRETSIAGEAKQQQANMINSTI